MIDTTKEARRHEFFRRVKVEPKRITLMRGLALDVGLSPKLWPNEGDPWRETLNLIPDCSADRGTGKTTRMLLAAVVDACLDHRVNKIVVFGHRCSFEYFKDMLIPWLAIVGLTHVRFEVARPERLEDFKGVDHTATRFYCNHDVQPKPDLGSIGQTWTPTP